MPTAPTATKPPRIRRRDPAAERAVTLWLPVELVDQIDRYLAAQRRGLVPGARISRHGLVVAAIRQLVGEQRGG